MPVCRSGRPICLIMPFCAMERVRYGVGQNLGPALHPGLPDGARALPIRERDLNGHAIFVTHRPGDMAFAGDVLDQFDAAWPDQDLFATRNLQLAVAAEGDEVPTLFGRGTGAKPSKLAKAEARGGDDGAGNAHP